MSHPIKLKNVYVELRYCYWCISALFTNLHPSEPISKNDPYRITLIIDEVFRKTGVQPDQEFFPYPNVPSLSTQNIQLQSLLLQLRSLRKEHTPIHLLSLGLKYNALPNNLVIKVLTHSSILEHLLDFLLQEAHMRNSFRGLMAMVIILPGQRQLPFDQKADDKGANTTVAVRR